MRENINNIKHKWKTSKNICNTYDYDSSVGKESTCNAGDPGSIPGTGKCPGEEIWYPLQYSWASLVAQMLKNLPAMWETWVWSLSPEDPLEEGMATHSSVLAWRIPWTENPGGLQSMESLRVGQDWATKPPQHNQSLVPRAVPPHLFTS